jgi:hypothetical protein
MKVWQAVPRIVKQSASKWVEDNYSTRTWHLHAALPIEKNVRKTRSFLQKAILGEVVRRGMSDVLLVFTSTDDSATSHAETLDVTEEIKSVSSQTSAPVSEGAVSRIELSMMDVVQMREWLLNRGVSPAKADHLESLITIRDQVPPKSQQMIYGDGERPAADKAYNLDSDRTVRFADDFAPYSTASAQVHVPNKLGSYDNAFRVEPRSSLYAPRQVPSGSRNHYGRPPPPPPVMIYNNRYTDTSPSRHARYRRDETVRSRDQETPYGIEGGRTVTIDPERPYRDSSSEYPSDASWKSSLEWGKSDNHKGDGRRHYTDSRPSRKRELRDREYVTRERERERERVAAGELEREIRELEREREQLKKERTKEEAIRERERRQQLEWERIALVEVEPSSAHEIDLGAAEVGMNRRASSSVPPVRTGPKIRFDTTGTSIYDLPSSLSVPRASEPEQRPSKLPPGLSRLPSDRRQPTDQVHYPRTQKYTRYDYEEGERDLAETRRNSHRSREAASKDILGWGEMDSRSRQPKAGDPIHSHVDYYRSRRKGSGRSDYRERDAHYVSDDDMGPFRQRQAKRIPTESNIDTEVLTNRRDLSPEQIREIAEDAEDAMLDDEELKDKMLTRYTSIAAPPVASDSPVSNIHLDHIPSGATDARITG